MGDHPVRYLPAQLAGDLERWAPPEITGSEMFGLHRLAERIYAAGYDDGHRRGMDEARAYAERPNVNQVNALRDAVKAKDGDRG